MWCWPAGRGLSIAGLAGLDGVGIRRPSGQEALSEPFDDATKFCGAFNDARPVNSRQPVRHPFELLRTHKNAYPPSRPAESTNGSTEVPASSIRFRDVVLRPLLQLG